MNNGMPRHAVDRDDQYPAHWWAPIVDASVPEWEILPQAARREDGEVILSKRHELGILSNFAPTSFEFRGKRYASIEGLWQMMFYPDPQDHDDPRARAHLHWPHTREEVGQMSSHQAKIAGDFGFDQMEKLGIDWVSFQGKRMKYWTAEKGDHYRLIVEAMRAKIGQNDEVRKVLLSTGNLLLRPDHRRPVDCPPSWRYDQIWMEIRSDLRK